MSDFHIKVRAELTADFLSSILITAFDGDHGGSWYWADRNPAADSWLKVKEEGALGSGQLWLSASVIDKAELEEWMATKEPDDPHKVEVFNVTHSSMVDGIQDLIDAGNEELQQAIFDADAGMIDADLADAIVQQALFGEQRYG